MIEVVYSSCTLPNCPGPLYNGAFVSLDYGLLAAFLALAAVILRSRSGRPRRLVPSIRLVGNGAFVVTSPGVVVTVSHILSSRSQSYLCD